MHKWWMLAGFGVFGGVLILNGYFPQAASWKRIGAVLSTLIVAGLLVGAGWYIGHTPPEIANKAPAPKPRPTPLVPPPTSPKPEDRGGGERPLSRKPASTPQRERANKPKPPASEPAPALGLAPATGSISQSNSGGINIQQGTTGNYSPIINSPITVGDIPKAISPENMKELVSYLKTATNKAKVTIYADQFSGGYPFPSDFYDALKNANWDMTDKGVINVLGVSPPGRRFQGAVIHIKGVPLAPGETVNSDATDAISYIGRALEAFKVPRVLQRERDLDEGLIRIQFEGGFPK